MKYCNNVNVNKCLKIFESDLSMNKLPVQQSFFTDSTGDLLPTLEFLGGLYNFSNLVIILSLM